MTSIGRTSECRYFNTATLSDDLRAERLGLDGSDYSNGGTAGVTGQKHVMSVGMFKWKQDACRHASIMTSTICLGWHAQNDMPAGIIVCQKHDICWYAQVTEATYARVSKFAGQKTRLRTRYARSYTWIEYIGSGAIARAMHQGKLYENLVYLFCIAVQPG